MKVSGFVESLSLLPADVYTVVNKTILTEIDKKNLISLYEPIIGPMAISLYLTLWRDLDKLELISIDFTHHHLMTILKINLDTIKLAREGLEGVGLLKTYYKEGDVNNYVYELYSPLSAVDFFAHPIFNVILYNNIGKKEYEMLKIEYEKIKFNLSEYEDVSLSLNMTFKSVSSMEVFEVKQSNSLAPEIKEIVDFDLIISSLPKGLINEKTFNKRVRELINNLSFVYNLDSMKMIELLRTVINESGFIDKDHLRKAARNYYQYSNNGTLPTLVYRTQPDYLKTPIGDTTNRGKIIYVFENTSPFDFLKSKYKGNPTARDLRLLESLIVDIGLKPGVINVLIDYVLRRDNYKLSAAFVETIAGQWKRLGIETASEAMAVAEKEHKKYTKKDPIKNKKSNIEPVWFNEIIEKEEINAEEQKELEDLLKEFR